MPRFRKKPVEVEAVQFTGGNHIAVACWMGCECGIGGVEERCVFDHSMAGPRIIGIRTLEGTMTAQRGDWIIKGVQGEFYPCKPLIFDATYEAVAFDELQGEQR